MAEEKGIHENINLVEVDIADMPGLSFECECGRTHSVGIKKIVLGCGIQDEIVGVLSALNSGKIFMMADAYTYEALGASLERRLIEQGCRLKTFVFDTGSGLPLVPDEKATGRLFMEAGTDLAAILAVGSGSINDLARFVGSRLKVPYIIAGTAPSMDGYASVVSPLMVNGFKTTFEGVYPYAIIADTEVMRKAPMDMINAGFGDVIGKLTALADWKLAKVINGEYYCENVVQLVEKAVGKCINNAGKIALRDETGIKYLIEALILTGVAMGLIGNSRPASGAEHHLAHYWEMEALKKGEDHPLHGNSVGAAAVVIAAVYELAAELLPEGVTYPKSSYVEDILEKAGSKTNPAKLGIDRELFKKSLLHAMEIRERFTILRFTASKGMLERIAETLTRRFYD